MAVIVSKQIKIPSLGKKASDYSIGDSVFLPVNGINTEFLVVHQGNPNIGYYDNCDGTWLLMKDCYNTSAFGSNNSYESSTAHSYLNSTFYNLLGAVTQGRIKQVKIPYRPGSGTSTTIRVGANGLSTKVFLLGATETRDGSFYGITDGAKLDYFIAGEDTDACNRRKAKYAGSDITWWLRTPDVSYNAQIIVRTYGGLGDRQAPSSIYGYRPACIIDFGTRFDADTNIIKG